jgi:hypothetical protein
MYSIEDLSSIEYRGSIDTRDAFRNGSTAKNGKWKIPFHDPWNMEFHTRIVARPVSATSSLKAKDDAAQA